MIWDTLRDDQKAAVNRAIELGGRMPVFSEVRCGKTRCALAFAERMQVQRMLLLGYDSYFNAWEWELKLLEDSGHPFYLPFVRLSSGRPVPERALELRKLRRSRQPALVAVNYDAWWRGKLRQEIRMWQPDFIVPDEAHILIHNGNHTHKFMKQITMQEEWGFEPYIMPLTGTPQEKGHEQLYHLFACTNPDVFGNDWKSFEEYFLEYEVKYNARAKGPVKTFHVVTGYKHERELLDTVHANSFRITQDVVGILKPEETVIPIHLNDALKAQYKSFMKKAVEEFTSTLSRDRLKVVGDIKPTLIMKGRELASGWIMDEAGKILDISREKLDTALEIIRTEREQDFIVCVWVGFDHDAERLCKELKISYEDTYTGLPGDTKHLGDLYKRFQAGRVPILIGMDRLSKESLNFSKARAAVFYSTGPSYIVDKQLSGRLQGTGLHREHFRLMSLGTVDEVTVGSLKYKGELDRKVWTRGTIQKITQLDGPELDEVLETIGEKDDWDEWIRTTR